MSPLDLNKPPAFCKLHFILENPRAYRFGVQVLAVLAEVYILQVLAVVYILQVMAVLYLFIYFIVDEWIWPIV